jgi:hypothetical protein
MVGRSESGRAAADDQRIDFEDVAFGHFNLRTA